MDKMANSTDMLPAGQASSSSSCITNKKRKKHKKQKHINGLGTTSTSTSTIVIPNPLLDRQEEFLKGIPENVRTNFFSDEHTSPDERARIWEEQADLGEELIDRYAWATPDLRALQILKEFNPIIEIGCGSNAYWAKCMKHFGMDVLCYDKFHTTGGKLHSTDDANTNNNYKHKNSKKRANNTHSSEIVVRRGGPEVLSLAQNKSRTLFLCYPDEEEQQQQQQLSSSMAEECLRYYTGTHIIHVGELYGDSISLDQTQAPWGRSTSWKFQLELQKSFHLVLKCSLKSSWLHVRDTISIWKRTTVICAIVFAASSDDDDDDDGSNVEEVQYKHIPMEERLPIDVAAPCMQHLL